MAEVRNEVNIERRSGTDTVKDYRLQYLNAVVYLVAVEGGGTVVLDEYSSDGQFLPQTFDYSAKRRSTAQTKNQSCFKRYYYFYSDTTLMLSEIEIIIMETNTWYSSSSQKDYDELFIEIKDVLTQEGWKIESYQNTVEVLANSSRIFLQGLDQKNDTEILIVRPSELEITSNPQTPAIPVIITEFNNEAVVSTMGLSTFESMYNSVDEQAAQAIWNQLIEVIERATTPTSADN